MQTGPPVIVTAHPVSGGYDPKKPSAAGSAGIYGQDFLVELDTTEQRHAFIRKVYGILSVQLLITFGSVAFFSFYEPAQEYIQERPGLFFAAIFLSFGLVITLSCFTSVARSYPWGPIFLLIFTLAESLIIGMIAAEFAVLDVIIAVGATAVIVISLSIFACQTKYDFTGIGPYLFIGLIVLILFLFVLLFIQESREVRIIFSILAVLLFSVFLVFDTQLIVGGKHTQFQLGVDDYVFAALSLYLDIINIFIYILLIFGGGGDS